jgi:beta-1,3-galactosyltransferase 1
LEESEKYNDLIQERFVDSYQNLTLKSITMLKLFHLHCAKSHKYLMKIDDDVFLNVNNLLEMLENRGCDTNLLVGKLMRDTPPFRDPTSKWFVPYESYPEEKYPDYLCGPAYVMSGDVAVKLYRCALETPIFFIEDVYITGFCAKKVNVAPQKSSLFSCYQDRNYVCLHRHVYALHHYKPREIQKAHRILKEDSCPPPGSILVGVGGMQTG